MTPAEIQTRCADLLAGIELTGLSADDCYKIAVCAGAAHDLLTKPELREDGWALVPKRGMVA